MARRGETTLTWMTSLPGVRAAIDYDASKYEIINLGESRTVELRELISLLEKALGKKAQIDRQPMQPGDVPQTFADIAKARRLLNYNPQTQIEDGIKKFVEWFQESARALSELLFATLVILCRRVLPVLWPGHENVGGIIYFTNNTPPDVQNVSRSRFSRATRKRRYRDVRDSRRSPPI